MPFKIYADFECDLKGVQKDNRGNNVSYTKKYQQHIPCRFTYKVLCIDDRFSKPIVLYRGKNAVNRFIKVNHKEYRYCRKVMKKQSNKDLVMSVENEKDLNQVINAGYVRDCLLREIIKYKIMMM